MYLASVGGKRKKGNAVLVDAADAVTDFGVAAKIAAAFTGAFIRTPGDFERQDLPQGIQYTEKLRSSRTTYHVVATANLQADLPTLPHLLRTLAQTPSGCVKLYMKPKKLCKFFKKHAKGTPRLLQLSPRGRKRCRGRLQTVVQQPHELGSAVRRVS